MQKVPVGVTSAAGYAATVTGLITTVLVSQLGLEQEQALEIAAAAWTVGAFLVTQVGRYAQAHALAKAQRPGTASVLYSTTGGASPVNFTAGNLPTSTSTAVGGMASGAVGGNLASYGGIGQSDDQDIDDELPPQLLNEEPSDPDEIPEDKGDAKAGSA